MSDTPAFRLLEMMTAAKIVDAETWLDTYSIRELVDLVSEDQARRSEQAQQAVSIAGAYQRAMAKVQERLSELRQAARRVKIGDRNAISDRLRAAGELARLVDLYALSVSVDISEALDPLASAETRAAAPDPSAAIERLESAMATVPEALRGPAMQVLRRMRDRLTSGKKAGEPEEPPAN